MRRRRFRADRRPAGEFFDGADDFDAVLVAEVGGEAGDAAAAQREGFTAAGEGFDDLHAGDVELIRRIVEASGETDDMGGVEADEAHFEFLHDKSSFS